MPFRRTVLVLVVVVSACQAAPKIDVKPEAECLKRGSTASTLNAACTAIPESPKTATALVATPSPWLALKVIEQQVLVRGLREEAVIEQAVANQARPQVRIGTAITATAPTDIGSVMDCIKNHESGNYTESSHPNSGSGAYQYVPGTWRTWSARAGYPGYDYAYEAPASVQDAVTAYALTHGGSHNWSPRYGNDPCTAGLPGGG